MTDKEFKQLSRPQLIDIIYQLQLKIDELAEQKQSLEKALEDKRLRINTAGSIAKAALEINDCFINAQKAADQYLAEIKAIRDEIETEREQIIAEARAEAESIVSTRKKHSDRDSVIDAILKEYGHNHSKNR